MRRRNFTGAGLLALALLLTAVPARADDPQPPVDPIPGGFATWEALFAEQNKLNDGVDAVRAAASQAGDTGYASAVADPTARALVLYWKGTPSAAVQAAITARRQLGPVTVRPAPYNEAQIVAETTRIAATSGAFYAVEPRPDASGVTVTWLDGQQNAQLQADTIAQSSVQVAFDADAAPDVPQPLSRQNDASPFSGGARTSNCTAAFAANHSTGTKLLYAAHCAANGVPVRDGAGDSMGTVGARNSTRDVSYISVLAAGKVWDGGPQSSVSKWVQDSTPSVVGNSVCSSGSRSGVICGGTVKAVNLTVGGLGPMVRVEASGAFAGSGDSGGPVFSLGSGGKVRAQGIISSGAQGYTAACKGETGRSCYRRVHYADVRQTLAFWGMSIRTTG